MKLLQILKKIWESFLKQIAKESPKQLEYSNTSQSKSETQTKPMNASVTTHLPKIAFSKPKREVTRIFLHCSASDQDHHDDIGVIKQWHLDRNFNGVGYHYFIKKNGEVQAGRSLERNPAAQRNHNHSTIAICLHGLRKENFTRAQLEALYALCWKINLAYSGEVTFHGHCEVANKSCPVFDYKSVLNLSPTGEMLLGETH